MMDKKKLEVLLKIIQRTFDQNPEKEKVIDMSMIEICGEESVSPEQAFFLLLFLCCFFIIMAIQGKNLNKSAENIKSSIWKFYWLN